MLIPTRHSASLGCQQTLRSEAYWIVLTFATPRRVGQERRVQPVHRQLEVWLRRLIAAREREGVDRASPRRC